MKYFLLYFDIQDAWYEFKNKMFVKKSYNTYDYKSVNIAFPNGY